MNVQVLAPTETLWINQNGEDVHQTGAWKLFTPQEVKTDE